MVAQQIGHLFRDSEHFSQVTRCAQGMKTMLMSLSMQTLQSFSLWSCSSFVIGSSAEIKKTNTMLKQWQLNRGMHPNTAEENIIVPKLPFRNVCIPKCVFLIALLLQLFTFFSNFSVSTYVLDGQVVLCVQFISYIILRATYTNQSRKKEKHSEVAEWCFPLLWD